MDRTGIDQRGVEFHRTSEGYRVPHMSVFDQLSFCRAVFAGSMISGSRCDSVGVLASPYALQLWLGLYGNPAEWP